MSKEMNYIRTVMESLDISYHLSIDYKLFGQFLSELDDDILEKIIDEIIPFYESQLSGKIPDSATDYYNTQHFYSLEILKGLVNDRNKNKAAKEFNIKLLTDKNIPHKILKIATGDYDKLEITKPLEKVIDMIIGIFESNENIIDIYINSGFAEEILENSIAKNADFCKVLKENAKSINMDTFNNEKFEKVLLKSIKNLHPMSKSRFVRNIYQESFGDGIINRIPLGDMIKKSKDEKIKKSYLEEKLKN